MRRRHACHLAVAMISILQSIHCLPADVTSADTRPAQSAGNPGVTEDPRSARNPPSSSADRPSSFGGPQRPNSPDSSPTQGGNTPQSQGSRLSNHNQDERPDLQGPPPFGPPCRVVLLSNNSVLVNQQCPPTSNCTEAPPHVNANPNREIDVFFCTPPPGFRERFPTGGPQLPLRCLVVDKETNDTRFNAECPPGTSCQVLDHRNPDNSVDIFLCTPPKQSAGDVVNQRRVSPPCKVVQKSSGTTVDSTGCPPETSCTEVDQRNPDTSVEVYLCAPSSQPSSRS